jgi:hypothetical protein
MAGSVVARAVNAEADTGPEPPRRPGDEVPPAVPRLADLLAIIWVAVAAFAILTPALIHGASLGPYDWLTKFGLAQQHGVIVRDIHGDQITEMIPWTQLAWTQVHSGHLPLWNSYSGLGMPLAFNWQSAAFSLPALVGYAVPLRLAFTAQVIVTLIIAGSGAYVLARILNVNALGSALCATVFELSGALMFFLGWPIGSVFSWGGWIFAAILLIMRGGHRVRDIAALAFALAFAIYAGQPDALVVLVVAAAVFALTLLIVRFPVLKGSGPIMRPAVDLVVATAAGFCLAAPLILPGYKIASAAIRIEQGGSFDRQIALPLHRLFYLPFGALNGFGPQLSGAYLGAIVVVLAVTAIWIRRRRPEVIALVAVLVIMGAIAFVQPVETSLHSLPGVQAVRWSRALVPMVLSIAALAGLGTDLLVRSFRDRSVRRWLGIGFIVAGLALFIAWADGLHQLTPSGHARLHQLAPLSLHDLNPAEAGIRNTAFIWAAIEVVVGLTGMGALVLSIRRHTARSRYPATVARAVGATFLVCIAAYLVVTGQSLWHSSASYITTTPAELSLQDAVGTSLVGLGAKDCFLNSSLGIRPDANDFFGIHELSIYDPMLPQAYFTSWNAVTGLAEGSAGFPTISTYCPAITSAVTARAYGVKYVLEVNRATKPQGSVYDRQIGNEYLFRIPGSGPATLTPLRPDHALPSITAVGTVVPVTHPGPASWRIVTNAKSEQILRLRLTATPGWQATIDGRPLALTHFANVMLQAKIPPGRHTIELHYWPDSFNEGLIVAGLTLLGLIVAFVYERVRRVSAGSHSIGTAS